ncbi:MAG: DUF1308 domain-containing protein [Nostocales cyanobacterium LE14-WE4]|jgi:hypothetical protein|nr:DUF1308 domain-containing protein [Anabaena sp. 49633_E8]MCE2700258.1 DUF1308 domain-containing protein [Anabaena sp. 49633_E8]MDJ0500153.1 DUF1308 domain-containing protein [Nostocales cyanobacterium LE14-WE4]
MRRYQKLFIFIIYQFNYIIILGTGDQLNIFTTTADAKAVRAASAQGVDFHVYIHPPFPLTGN